MATDRYNIIQYQQIAEPILPPLSLDWFIPFTDPPIRLSISAPWIPYFALLDLPITLVLDASESGDVAGLSFAAGVLQTGAEVAITEIDVGNQANVGIREI